MDLIDRYLEAVGWWLPRDQKEDILAELREDLQSEIDERSEAAGRALTETEVEDLLRQRGRPMKVALRYLPQRPLIGAAIAPMYHTVLKGFALFYLLPYLIVWIVLSALTPSHLAKNPLPGFLDVAVFGFAAITIIFAAIDRYQQRAETLDWNPRTLAPVKNVRRIPRGSTLLELISAAIFLVWWVDTPSLGYALPFTAGPVWAELRTLGFIPVIVVQTLTIALDGVNLVRPYWTRPRFMWKAANSASVALVLTYVLGHRAADVRASWTHIADGSLARTPAFVTAWANVTISVVLAFIALTSAMECVRYVYRAVRIPRQRPAAAPPSHPNSYAAFD